MRTYKELNWWQMAICTIEFWYFPFSAIVQTIGFFCNAGKWMTWAMFIGFLLAYGCKILYICFKSR